MHTIFLSKRYFKLLKKKGNIYEYSKYRGLLKKITDTVIKLQYNNKQRELGFRLSLR